MKLIHKIIFKIIILFLCSNYCLPEGFAAGTLVKMSSGYTKIENLKIDDIVVCFDENKVHTHSRITGISKKPIDEYLSIAIANEVIYTALDQQLYDENNSKWIALRSLPDDQLLKNCSIKIECIKKPIDVYVLTVEQYHNFFITKADLCVHNFFPPIVIGLSIAFGSGSLEIAGISCGVAGLGTFLGYKWYKKNKESKFIIKAIQSDTFQEYNINDAQAPGMPTEKDGYHPPKKWDGKKVNNPNGGGFGWPDKKGHIWIPTGPKAHRGPHWDVQDPKTGRHRNVLPGGKVC